MAEFVWYHKEDDQFVISNGIGTYMTDGYRFLPINEPHNEFRIIRSNKLVFIGAL